MSSCFILASILLNTINWIIMITRQYNRYWHCLVKHVKYFGEKHGFMPTFFIDGIDLVAKSDENQCIQENIVNEAKCLANAGSIRIVLVSSEGTIMPLLQNISSYSRAKTIEILDIDEKKTVKYLVDYEMPEMLAINVFALVGGRLTMLVSRLPGYL